MARTHIKIITKYLPESKITVKGYLDQQKKGPVTAASENIIYIATMAGETTTEIFLQLFDPTKNMYITLLGNLQ